MSPDDTPNPLDPSPSDRTASVSGIEKADTAFPDPLGRPPETTGDASKTPQTT